MIVYLFLIVILWGTYPLFGKLKKGTMIYCGLAFGLLAALSCIRENIGVDYKNYLYFFNEFEQNHSTGDFEPGFMLLETLSLKLHIGFRGLIMITSLLTQGCVMYAIYRNSSNVMLSALLYVTMGFYYSTLNQIRMYLAISIVMLAFYYLKKDKACIYFGIVLIASMFHYTALIMLPLYFFLKLKWTTRQFIAISALLFGAVFLIRPLLELGIKLFPKYEYYLSSIFAGGYQVQSLHRVFLIFVPLLAYKKMMLRRDKDNLIYINCALYAFAIALFQLQFQLFERFTFYLSMPALLLGWPEIAEGYKRTKPRQLVILLILLFGLVYNFYLLYRGWMGVVPFQTCL